MTLQNKSVGSHEGGKAAHAAAKARLQRLGSQHCRILDSGLLVWGGGQVSVLEPTLLLLRRMPRWGRDTTIASLPEYTSLR